METMENRDGERLKSILANSFKLGINLYRRICVGWSIVSVKVTCFKLYKGNTCIRNFVLILIYDTTVCKDGVYSLRSIFGPQIV